MPIKPSTSGEELFPSSEAVCAALKNELIIAQPTDVYQFCATYFMKKLSEQRSTLINLANVSPTSNKEVESDFSQLTSKIHIQTITHESSEEGSDVYLSGEESLGDSSDDDSLLLSSSDDEGYLAPPPVPNHNRGRRTSISAESMAPAKDGEFNKIVVPKTLEQRQRIETSISNNFLFKNLDEEQYKDVIDAMVEKPTSKGEDVIVQGGVGDYFYAVEKGSLYVFVSKDGGPETKVHEYGPGGSFGELALMYNAPRAATVRCMEDSVLWALDRVTFRRILMERTSSKRRMYESFLEEVPILSNLEPYERHKIADALESITYDTKEVVIQQGDTGQSFYIIESGEAIVTKMDDNGVEHILTTLKKGDYFGELALLNDQPRKATVSANGRLKCATLGKKAFVRLLGPCVEIITRNVQNYAMLANDP